MKPTYAPTHQIVFTLPANSPCRKCEKDANNCTKYRTCPDWREWFIEEWRNIQRAGDIAKKQREKARMIKERINATVNTRSRQKREKNHKTDTAD